MQIHELNNYAGSINDNSYLAIDNGIDTGRISADKLLEGTNSSIEQLETDLNARIDNIIAGGDAPSAAEIVDARLGAASLGSKTYPSLGDAIRGQVTYLNGELSNSIVNQEIAKGPLVNGEYVKFETGEFLPYGGWSRTDYIDCSAWVNAKINDDAQYCAFYDENKDYISQAKFIADTNLMVPDSAAYIVLSTTTTAMANIEITANVKTPIYEVNEKINDLGAVVETYEKQEPQQLIVGYLISDVGNQLESVDWVCTDYLEMPFNEISPIIVRGTFYGTGGCAIFDENRNLLMGVDGTSASQYGGVNDSTLQTLNIPYIDGAKFIRISGWKNNVSEPSDLWVSGNTAAGAFERINVLENDVKSIKANTSTTISKSKVLVIGDSISADAYGNYPKWVTDLINEGFFPQNTLNSSRHATGFVARYDNQPNDFITRLKSIADPSQYDLVVVFGGINDYIQNIPMGSESGTDYTVSFKPAVNEFFNYLIQNFTQARLCVLLPLRTYATWKNSVNEYQQAYGDYIKQIAQSYCLPVLNLTEESGFCPFISTFSDMWTLQPEGFESHDGVHPNEEYERKYLAPMIKHFLQGLL